MNVDLSPELEELIEESVRSGRYASVREVLSDALRLLDRRDRLVGSCVADYTDAIEEGWQAAQRGDFVDADKVFDRIDSELAELDFVGLP
jgi:antitoxin ParD1/3/4